MTKTPTQDEPQVAGAVPEPTDFVCGNSPKGIVLVLVNADGREVATASDFHNGSPCGYTQRETQEIRAKEALAMATMRALASPQLSNAIAKHMSVQILIEMCRQGCRVVTVPVGYEED